MSAIEIKYVFAEKVYGVVLLTEDHLRDAATEDDIVGIVQDLVAADLMTGVDVTNLDSVVHWGSEKMKETRT